MLWQLIRLLGVILNLTETAKHLSCPLQHLRKQAKKTENFTFLQRGSLYGIEPKTLPYLLCQMNLLLHGLEYPEIDPGNALRFPLREIGDKDRGNASEHMEEDRFPKTLGKKSARVSRP